MAVPEMYALRRQYHERLCASILGYRGGGSGALTVADSASATSVDLARRMAQAIGLPLAANPKEGQTAGKLFTEYTEIFLEEAFHLLRHIRPGNWVFSVSQAAAGIARFDQYEHLAKLSAALETNPELKTALGVDYLVTPDIVVARRPLSDEEINAQRHLVDKEFVAASLSPLRAEASGKALPILHASISCKWTMRSDRAQNTRTEALNLIRNRKGNSPHIVAVTLEPMPSRLASIAMGTGDIDCTYHAALHELQEAVKNANNLDQAEILETLVNGRRLRDISDLPFDLAV